MYMGGIAGEGHNSSQLTHDVAGIPALGGWWWGDSWMERRTKHHYDSIDSPVRMRTALWSDHCTGLTARLRSTDMKPSRQLRSSGMRGEGDGWDP